MGTKFLLAHGIAVSAAGATTYMNFGSDSYTSGSGTEANRAPRVRDVGTFDYMTARCSAFSLGGGATQSVFTSRVNSAPGNQTVSVTSATTFQDTTHSDSMTGLAGQTYGSQAVTDAGTGSITMADLSCRFAGDSSTNVMRYGLGPNRTFSSANVTNAMPLAGCMTQDATSTTFEAYNQTKFRAAATLQYLSGRLSANTTAGANSSIVSRTNISGAGITDGNLVATITAGSGAATVEDTTHSDSLASGDLASIAVKVGGVSSGNFALQYAHADCVYSGSDSAHYVASGDGVSNASNQMGAPGVSHYCAVQGVSSTSITTESSAAAQFTLDTSSGAQTSTYMSAQCPAAPVGDVQTMTSRKNSGAGNQTLAMNALGYFEDSTHSDSISQTDTIDFKVTGGAGITTKGNIGTHGLLMTAPGASTSVAVFYHHLQTQGIA